MAIDAKDFEAIAAIVREKSAIVLEAGKEYLVESRLVPVASAHGMKDLHQLAMAMKAQPRSVLVDDVVDAMTTNETSFFRDVRPFEALKGFVIPALIKARSAQRALTIWCGASSTGQEPYSIAMMLTDNFPELASWNVRILGTDISPTAVKAAQNASYSQLQVNRGVPAPMLVKHFDRRGMEWHIKQDIKARVEFKVMNLVAPWPAMPTVDLVMLRNVLIYFDNASREQILTRVHGTLASDGYLMLGSTESTIGLRVPFVRDEQTATGCLRPAGGAAPSPKGHTAPAMTVRPAINVPAFAGLTTRK